MKRYLTLILGAMLALSAAAQQSEVCEMVIGSGTSRALLSLYTDSLDRLVLRINAGDGGDDALTLFRGNGVNEAGLKFGTAPLTDYFTRTTQTINNAKEVIYTPIASMAPQHGTLVTFNRSGENAYTEWKTSQNTNAYSGSISFSYTYGRTCPQLPAPVLTAISADSVPQFEAVDGATSYMARVYLNGIFKYSQTIQAGDALHFLPLRDATYQVTLSAQAEGIFDSEESEPVDWLLTRPEIVLGTSEYCGETFGSGASAAAITWETLASGDVAITISGDASTFWRGNGMNGTSLADFTVAGEPASNYFSRLYSGSGSSVYTLHLKDSTVRPALGELISFSGTVEWMTQSNSNAYGTLSFAYTYGTICPGLQAPTGLAISADSVLTFTPADGATYYLARVYLGEVLKYTQTVQSGDVLHYLPYESADYTVTVTSCCAGKLDSDESEPYTWTLTAPEIVIGASEYCSIAFGSGDQLMYLTLQTLDNGDVEIAISGDEGTTFRGNGFGAAGLPGFTVGSVAASTYFDRQFDGDRSSLYTLHLRDTASHPAFGEQIRFSGTVEWRTAGNSNAYGTLSLVYTYGAVCPSLETPAILSITDGVLNMAEPLADEYRLYIYRGELLVGTYTLHNGDTIPFTPVVSYLYTVYAEAHSTQPGTVPSALSEPYLWHLTAAEQEQELSTVCDLFVSSQDDGVTLTAETDDDGQIIFTIRGPQAPVWRAAGLSLDGMNIGGNRMADYFSAREGFVGDTVLVLRPTRSGVGVFYPGDRIAYNGAVEWTIPAAAGAGVARWVTDYQFSYIYGTTCRVQLPRLDTPQSLAVTDEGEATFQPVADADSYEVRVLDEDADEMLRHELQSGDTILRQQTVYNPFTYLVSVRSLPADITLYRPSFWSESVIWHPSYIAIPDEPEEPEEEDPWKDSALEDIVTSGHSAVVLYRGQLLIIHDGHAYDMMGRIVSLF